MLIPHQDAVISRPKLAFGFQPGGTTLAYSIGAALFFCLHAIAFSLVLCLKSSTAHPSTRLTVTGQGLFSTQQDLR